MNSIKKKILFAALAVLTALLLSFGIVSVIAKYAEGENGDQIVTAHTFYFNSNALSAEGEEYSYNAATESISFALRNYEDALRFSTLDISYTVSVTCAGATVYTESGTLPGGAASDKTITVSGLESGKTYDISVTGTNGYVKTLRATYTIKSEIGFYKSLEFNQHMYYVILKVWTADTAGDIVITAPSELIPDNTWDGMESAITGQSITTAFSEYSAKSYRFLVPSGYTGDYEFSVKLGDVEAENKGAN